MPSIYPMYPYMSLNALTDQIRAQNYTIGPGLFSPVTDPYADYVNYMIDGRWPSKFPSPTGPWAGDQAWPNLPVSPPAMGGGSGNPGGFNTGFPPIIPPGYSGNSGSPPIVPTGCSCCGPQGQGCGSKINTAA